MNTNDTVFDESTLKPYQPFGIPLLKLLFGITLVSLAITAFYEFLL